MQFLCTSLLQIIYFRCADGNERKQPNIIWQHNTDTTNHTIPSSKTACVVWRVWRRDQFHNPCAARSRSCARARKTLQDVNERRANNTFSIWHSHIHTIMRTQRQTCTHTNKIQQHHNSTQPTTAQWSQQFWTNIQKYIQWLCGEAELSSE